MAKLLALFLTFTLLAFAAVAQAQAPKPISQGPDFSGLEQGQLTSGKIDLFEEKYIARLRKYDPARANEFEAQIKRKIPSIDQVSQSYKNIIKIREQRDSEEKLFRDGFLGKKALARSNEEVKVAIGLWGIAREKYRSDLQKRYGPAKKTLARAMQKFNLITAAWIQKFNKASAKKREKMGLPKGILEGIDLKSVPPESEEKTPSPESAGNQLPKNPKEDIKKDKIKREETITARRQDREGPPKPKSEEDRIVEADEGGMLTGKAIKLTDLEGCGAVFLKFDAGENFGWVSTSCPGLTGGRIATQADYLTHCNSFDRPRRHCGPPGPGTEKRIEKSGIQGMPFSAFCLGLHFNILASKGDVFNNTVKAGKLVSVFKYDNGSRKLECFYVSFAQSKALREQFKNIGKDPGGKPTAAVSSTEPPASMSSPNRKTDVTTAIVKNPDGTRTITRTDRNGNVLTRVKVGGSPASMSSLDRKTGVTTAIVKNRDGTRTITRTNRNGKVLSQDTTGKLSTFASSTDPSTGETTKSVANPDGSRTVTKTDKDDNLLSREKVR